MGKSNRNFHKNERGNIAILAALLAVPIFGLAAYSVEFARFSEAKSKAQNILDEATLRPFTNDQSPSDNDNIKANIEKTFEASASVNGLQLSGLEVTKIGESYKTEASFDMPTIFGGAFGMEVMHGAVESQVTMGKRNLEIAFVLDNSGSMVGSRLSALKTSAKSTLDRFAAWESKYISLKMGIVPFSSMVNVGSGHKFDSWMDYNALSPLHQRGFSGPVNRFDLFDHLNKQWEGCVQSRGNGLDVTDAEANQGAPNSLFVPWFWPDEPDPSRYKTYPNSYLADTAGSNDLAKMRDLSKYGVNGLNKASWTAPQFTQQYSIYYNYNEPLGPNYFCDSKPLSPLTTNYSGLKTQIDDMMALGGTNLTEGLAWGWRILSPEAPFTEGLPYKDVNDKVLIFFTDGENAVNAFSSLASQSEDTTFGYAIDGEYGVKQTYSSQDLVDVLNAKTKAVCNNIKSKGIIIFTIGLDTRTTTARNLLKDCATTGSDSYLINDASQLQGAFNSISAKVINLYISQ